MYLKAIVSVFQAAVEDCVTSQQTHLELNESQFNTDAIPARRRLLAHHRKLLANILRWRKYSGPLFGIDQLLERLVSDAMLPIAESGWDVGGEDAMREVRSKRQCDSAVADCCRRLLRHSRQARFPQLCANDFDFGFLNLNIGY